ncbi:ATP-binding protein [Microcoleus sp. FACHB-672]|uniref:ATP-binding protein n=1 Tax=Microcoleus sp. FACHB-672 TaxID=2692825 RepID=UPI001683BD37|nr:ATP-binding protein [Microcoleus sp. FACHB-672]MBD2043259.1 response regulator [Microcoleus sp. FACHB-672]
MSKILVVDDDLTIQLVLRHLLERENCEVRVVGDGEEALLEVHRWHPDLMICDWMMPRLDGLEVCRRVKTNPKLATTFVILLTAREQVSDRVRGLDAGADEFLTKPIEPEELLARVRAGLRSRQLTQQLSQANQHLAALVEVQRRLLAFNSDDNCYNQIVELLGKTAGASRVYVVENCWNMAGTLLGEETHQAPIVYAQWWANEEKSQAEKIKIKDSNRLFSTLCLFPSRWVEMLAKGEIIAGSASEFPPEERLILEPLGIVKILLLPLTVNGEFFGCLGFEHCDCSEAWSASEIEFLRAAASAISLHQERSKAVSALRESEARYRAIVEDQTELICRFALDGTVTFVNDAYCRYFGVTQEDLRNKSLVPLIPDIERNPFKYPFISREQKVVLPSGEVRTQHWTGRAIFDSLGRFIEYQAVGIDITERKRAEEETLKALAKEKELGELKNRLISMVSHEFRTPLTTVLSSADLLEYYLQQEPFENSDKKLLEYIQRIQVAAVNMTELLEDVLFIGRTDAGKLPFNPLPLNLTQFCSQLVAEIQLCVTSNHKIHFVEIHPNILTTSDVPACMDEKLLRQILSNLLSNALKYSAEGGEVRLELICQECEAIFQIKDQGIGIPDEDITHLFESFHRAKNVGNIAGTGLGLAIVKRCVDLHEGEISVASKVGVGTTFTVTLPLMPKR